jgi:tight adherence protein B
LSDAFIKNRVERRVGAFADQLPDNLDVVASGPARRPQPRRWAVLVVSDAAEPRGPSSSASIADEQLGIPLEDALAAFARRMNSRDIEQVALVSSLQRETGGNAAEVLDRVTEKHPRAPGASPSRALADGAGTACRAGLFRSSRLRCCC